ncbi:MAG: glycerol-3-phosphate 1-O-acyltransferase PlsY [Alphaproteobacteria bacterium]|jgi:glycerol-3-phosphate acyltransferase PlsY|nr:glycerol-3-phosphate 1-O-acyltransferase PlsY [Alphaproteobacteria bacterium]MBP9877421.1 glycerol-3-phosphate 1-O-acyltransferase PlsY [Alphaproteobacteria bacterium]
MLFLYAILLGYFLGSIPFGLIYTKLSGHGDIRNIGSGNIGATNVLRTGNKTLAILTLLSDALKGLCAVLLLQKINFLPDFDLALLACAFASIIGHIFPIWLKFKGGKGVATAIGVIIALHWPIALGLLGTWVLIACITRISSLSALIAFVASIFYSFFIDDQNFTYFLLVITLLILYTHKENIGRLIKGTEPKIGQKK